MEDLRSATRVTAAKSVVSRRTLAQGAATPARKSYASVSVPTASSLAAYVAVTVESTLAHANNIADRVRKRRITVVLLAAIIARVVLNHRDYRAEELSYTVTPRKIQTSWRNY